MYIDEKDAQRAVEQTGFGKFNLKITAICALIYLNCAFCITSVGFVVPTAACDYKMDTIGKGRINAAPMLGMVLGSGIWGYYADLKGRRLALLISLFLQFAVDFLASVVPSYWLIVFLKVLSGIGVTGQLSTLFPYLGEFQPAKYRNQIMSWMELFWALGVITVALLAWIVIPLKFKLATAYFWFSSWNLFVLTSSLPALIVGIWLLTLPETPKFLAESGQREALMEVLARMFVENTGKSVAEFKEKLARCTLTSISSLVSHSDQIDLAKVPEPLSNKREKLKQLLNSSKRQVKTLVRKPHARRVCTTGSIMFCMSSTYYSLMTWFPELFQRFAAFEKDFPGEFASVCAVSKTLSESLAESGTMNDSNQTYAIDPYGCDVEIDTSVYVNSLWLGVACLPCAILLPLTVDRLGYRVYLVFTATAACAVTVAFFFVKTSTQNLVLSCIFEATTSINISVIFCLLVELFPTNLRVMATAITLFIGRIGSLSGNMLFGYLIDDYCNILILVMAAQLLFATIMCWSTPGRNKMRKIQGDVSLEARNKTLVL